MEWQNKMQDYDNRIKQRLKIKDPYIPHFHDITFTDWRLSMTSDKEFLEDYAKVIDSEHIPEQDSINPDNKKQESEPVNYVHMEIGLPRGPDGELQFARVKRQVLDDEGNPLGTSNNNPLLDGRMNEVEYLDSSTEILAANFIAENVMSQVNEDGHRQLLLDEIIDHTHDSTALSHE